MLFHSWITFHLCVHKVYTLIISYVVHRYFLSCFTALTSLTLFSYLSVFLLFYFHLFIRFEHTTMILWYVRRLVQKRYYQLCYIYFQASIYLLTLNSSQYIEPNIIYGFIQGIFFKQKYSLNLSNSNVLNTPLML